MLVTGVLLHVPEFLSVRDMHYSMTGMRPSGLMLAGMAAIVVGLAMAAYALMPPRRTVAASEDARSELYAAQFRAMDDAPVSRAHMTLLFVLGIALIIDVMKPATLGFVVPGLKSEYGISTAAASALPIVALTGTTIGSVIWGYVADALGRRVAIMLAALLFIATSICGFMPSFGWNLAMCFLMGASAGGMLPIVYALMAECVPARCRGWLVVLHGGMGMIGGYLAASAMATLLEPRFGWRILWLAGLPTGGLMLLLNRWIPESPRFLLANGRLEEAAIVMARFGVRQEQVERRPLPRPVEGSREQTTPRRLATILELLRPPLQTQSLLIGLYAVSWGLVNWGFLTFLPTILREDFDIEHSYQSTLFFSALLAAPGTVLVAWLYGTWGSRRTMVAYAMGTTMALGGLAALRPNGGDSNQFMLVMLVGVLLVTSSGVVSTLSPYAAEVYPTSLRGIGSGYAAAASKVSGMVSPPIFAGLLGVSTGFGLPAFFAAAPIALAGAMLGWKGMETRGQRLEDIER